MIKLIKLIYNGYIRFHTDDGLRPNNAVYRCYVSQIIPAEEAMASAIRMWTERTRGTVCSSCDTTVSHTCFLRIAAACKQSAAGACSHTANIKKKVLLICVHTRVHARFATARHGVESHSSALGCGAQWLSPNPNPKAARAMRHVHPDLPCKVCRVPCIHPP